MAIITDGSPGAGEGVPPPAGQGVQGARFREDSLSASSSNLDIPEAEKPVLTSAEPSWRARLNPKIWSRKMRILALTGLVLATLALVPAIAVPLVEDAKRAQQDRPAEPLFVNPPNTSLIANGTALRIMPLGASITYGYLSTDGNGYREDLLGLLHRGGNKKVTYVGSRHNGTMEHNAVEGWPGYRIDQVMPKAASSVPQHLPNVILLNVGTNDCVQNWNVDNTTRKSTTEPSLTANASINTGERLRIMVEDLFTWSPNVTVVMSTLIVNRNPVTNARVNDVNNQFRKVADEFKTQGRRVVLAEMDASAGGPNRTTMADVTHPNDVGYALMANRWYVALQEAGGKGLIVAPNKEASA